jgi:XTP/dITP diphosphohydrolase
VRAPVRLILASSNPGKLAEYRVLVATAGERVTVELALLPNFESFPSFEEKAPTFAENSAGKALYYSRHCAEMVFADDSGLVVPALGGAPGVQSARYAGPGAANAHRIEKLLREMRETIGSDRAGYFVCAIALAKQGRVLAVVTDRVEGEILESPRGTAGFGYDPVFYFPALRKTFAELSAEAKNQYSHRGKAFRRLLSHLSTML